MNFRILTAALCLAAAGAVNAQESVSDVKALRITQGFNADIIAEKRATPAEMNESGWNADKYYKSPWAKRIDSENSGGRNAFYSVGVQERGAIRYTADGYLDGNTDDIPYKLNQPTEANALVLKNNDPDYADSGTLYFEPVDGSEMPSASTIYLLTTSTEGASLLDVEIYGMNDELIGTTSVSIGDWWSEHSSERLTQVYETLRITVEGERTGHQERTGGIWRPTLTWNDNNGVGEDENQINYVNTGAARNGSFYLQRIAVSTLSNQAVKDIRLTKRVNTDHPEAVAVIMAATTLTEEVTVKDLETNLDYLYNTTTNQRIQETVKSKVNLHRNFNNTWNALVLPFSLTKAQAKHMFGPDIKVSVADETSFVGNRVIFYPIDMGGEQSEVAIERNKYYLINNVVQSQTVSERGLQVYSHTYLQYHNPIDFANLVPTFSASNENGDVVTFHGTYVSGQHIGQGSYALATDGNFYRYTDNPQIGAFRFWFTVQDATGTSKETPVSFEVDGETTAIETVESATIDKPTNNNIYSIDGRVVRKGNTSLEGLEKGMYIVNNKKVIVR